MSLHRLRTGIMAAVASLGLSQAVQAQTTKELLENLGYRTIGEIYEDRVEPRDTDGNDNQGPGYRIYYMAQVDANGNIDTTNMVHTVEGINDGPPPRQRGIEPRSLNYDNTPNPTSLPSTIGMVRENEGDDIIPDELYTVGIKGDGGGGNSNDNYAILRKAAPDETGDPYDLDPSTAPYVGFFHFGDPSVENPEPNNMNNAVTHFIPGTTNPTIPFVVNTSALDNDSSGTITAFELQNHLQTSGIAVENIYNTPQNISDRSVPRGTPIDLTPLSPTDIVDLTTQDTYYFSVRDSSGAKVTPNYLGQITITGSLNTAPSASPIALTGDEGQSLDIDFSQYGSDPDDQSLTYQIISSDPDAPTITISGDTGTVTMPATQTSTTYQYTYEVSDDQGATDTSTIILTTTNINNPIGTPDEIGVIINQTTSGNLLANDSDITAIDSYTLPATGTLTLDTQTGAYTYDAPATAGTDSFEYVGRNQFGELTDPITVTITVDHSIGVDDIERQDETVLYPNPVRDHFAIQIQGREISLDEIDLRIYNTSGALVATTNQISDLQPGLYIAHITYEGQHTTQKIIKQ